MKEATSELTKQPEDGCYIRGLYLEGARWDATKHMLAESRPKELYTDVPAIWLTPEANRKAAITGVYDCPVYKTLTRAGTAVLLMFRLKMYNSGRFCTPPNLLLGSFHAPGIANLCEIGCSQVSDFAKYVVSF